MKTLHILRQALTRWLQPLLSGFIVLIDRRALGA